MTVLKQFNQLRFILQVYSLTNDKVREKGKNQNLQLFIRRINLSRARNIKRFPHLHYHYLLRLLNKTSFQKITFGCLTFEN